MIRKHYIDTPLGQLHVRTLAAETKAGKPPLVCLHPSPYSGAYFDTIMPLLNGQRDIVALDYPGYGNSYVPTSQPDISDYAAAVHTVIEDITGHQLYGGRVDLLGFHTGCLVGVETAIRFSQEIRHLVLCDIPYFLPKMQASLLASSASPTTLDMTPSSIDKAWKMSVSSRLNIIPEDRIFELLGEHLRHGGHDHFGFDAAFRYPCDQQFKAVKTPTTIIATQSGLLQATLEAAKTIPHARLIETPEVTKLVFETGAALIAEKIQNAIDND
ncbi:MAG: alpha/beta fold hydrolase [Woeseiaceae bacterium]